MRALGLLRGLTLEVFRTPRLPLLNILAVEVREQRHVSPVAINQLRRTGRKFGHFREDRLEAPVWLVATGQLSFFALSLAVLLKGLAIYQPQLLQHLVF